MHTKAQKSLTATIELACKKASDLISYSKDPDIKEWADRLFDMLFVAKAAAMGIDKELMAKRLGTKLTPKDLKVMPQHMCVLAEEHGLV